LISYEPSSIEACAELLSECARDKRRLGFIGGGTALELGNPPSELDAVVRTRQLKHIVEYAPEDQVIVAEAGVTLSQLQSLARSNGQWLGVDAPDAERATLGGLVAVGGFGPRRARYGGIRDLLLGVALVRADGAVAKSGGKVVKNVAGFDLPKVVCGSLGSLGLIAHVTVRLHPLPKASATVTLSDVTPCQVVDTVRGLRRVQLEPSSVVALRTGEGRFELGVRFEGFARGVERDAGRFADLAQAMGSSCKPLSEREAEAFWLRQDAVRTEGRLRVRIAALPTQLAEVQDRLAPLLAGLRAPSFAWYATLGIGFASGEPEAAGLIGQALEAARAGALRLGGSLVVEAAPAAVRASFDAWGPPPSAFFIMQGLKQRFDPERRLNAGRFVGGL
jgi:glycolate oxidase FAD binding subunit